MSELSRFRQLLSDFFNESELRTLAFDLGLDYEMLPGPTKGDKARELVLHMWRTGRLDELVALGRETRPNIEWPDATPEAAPMPAMPASPPPQPTAPSPQPAATHPSQPPANPFTYGNPISDPARFFGRGREVEQVFNRLRNSEGESSSIVGGRRIGKSSLLNYLAHPDVQRRYGMDPERAIFVYVDLQMVDDQTTPARLWQRLLTQMARHCRDDELAARLRDITAAGTFDNFTLADLFDLVDSRGRQVVFLLDEFENVTSNPNFDPGFFYGLRSLAIQHNLSLVTSSRYELIELTHSQAIRSSPFFNIFANINVRLMNETEARRLVDGLLAGSGVEFSEEEAATLAEVAGGHPFFLQAAGYFLFEAYGDHADAGRRRAAWLKAFSAEVEPHLAHYWHTTDLSDRITLFLLALLARGADGRPAFDAAQLERHYPRAGQSLEALARLGYVADKGGRYALFSTTFAGWIMDEIRSDGQGQAVPEPAGWLESTLAAMPPDRKKALVPVLAKAGAAGRPIVAGLVEQSVDLAATIRLLNEGLGG